MSGSRWLAVLTMTIAIALGASRANAQVFKPRTGKAAMVASKAVPAAPAASSTTVARKTGPVAAAPAAATAKKPARTSPHRTAKKRGKARGDAEDVAIDDDDDDVKITDD